MFKSVLTALKPNSQHQYLIDYSVNLALQIKAGLTSCIVIDDEQISPPESVPIGGGALKRERHAELLTASRAAAEKCSKDFDAATAKAGIDGQTETVEGRAVDALAARSHEHDLVVIGHPAGSESGSESMLHQILKHVPRPAIVVPKTSFSGNSVVCGYDGSVQAARTLASFAYSGLGKGRTVHVLSCDADAARATELCDSACRFLCRHGLRIEAHPETPIDPPLKRLTTLAAEQSAGLIVMGAFGQPFIREFLFGSTTRNMLRELPVPVFVDH